MLIVGSKGGYRKKILKCGIQDLSTRVFIFRVAG